MKLRASALTALAFLFFGGQAFAITQRDKIISQSFTHLTDSNILAMRTKYESAATTEQNFSTTFNFNGSSVTVTFIEPTALTAANTAVDSGQLTDNNGELSNWSQYNETYLKNTLKETGTINASTSWTYTGKCTFPAGFNDLTENTVYKVYGMYDPNNAGNRYHAKLTPQGADPSSEAASSFVIHLQTTYYMEDYFNHFANNYYNHCMPEVKLATEWAQMTQSAGPTAVSQSLRGAYKQFFENGTLPNTKITITGSNISESTLSTECTEQICGAASGGGTGSDGGTGGTGTTVTFPQCLSDLPACLKLLFLPQEDWGQKWKDLQTLLDTKFPFGYAAVFNNTVFTKNSSLGNVGASCGNIAVKAPFGNGEQVVNFNLCSGTVYEMWRDTFRVLVSWLLVIVMLFIAWQRGNQH